MRILEKGIFFGDTNRRIGFNGLTLTDTEYTHEKVDWHYHENPYFTFILRGHMIEGNHKEIYHCSAGSLLFHNWDDAHYNTKPPGFTRGFHIEMEQNWMEQFELSTQDLKGSFSIKNPNVKLIFHELFKESQYEGQASQLAIESLLVQVMDQLQCQSKLMKGNMPCWVIPLRELLHDEINKHFSLSDIAQLFNIHPVHLSRYFPKFFGCSLGEYMRKIKIEKSINLLTHSKKSLVEIALESGFSDQSHFNRCFKTYIGTTPLTYRGFLES